MRNKIRNLLPQTVFFIVVISLWQFAGSISEDFHFVLGSPKNIAIEFFDLLLHKNLHEHFFITGSEAFIGLSIGTFLGCFLGLALWYSKNAMNIIRPYIIALGTLPLIAFAPLFIFWFGIGFLMKVAIAAFSTFFIAFTQANIGASTVSKEYIDVLTSMNASKNNIFRKVIVPASFNWVFNSMRLNVGFGLLGAFIGEFISSDEGLGFLILKASGVYNVSRALAAAICITALALLLDLLARKIEKYNITIVQWLSVPKIFR